MKLLEPAAVGEQVVSCLRGLAEERRIQFPEKGYDNTRPSFPHRIYYAPKCGPDALKLARRMCGLRDPNALWEVILYAHGTVLDEFPDQLFFDDDLMWTTGSGGTGRPGRD